MSNVLTTMSEYFNSLKDSIRKKDIMVDLGYTFNETETGIAPMFHLDPLPKLAGKVFTISNIEFKRTVKGGQIGSYAVIANVCDKILDNQDAIMVSVKNEFSDENLKVVTDYYKLSLIKYYEALNFYNEYSRRWANVVLLETILSAYKEKNINPDSQFTPNLIKMPTFNDDLEYVTNSATMASYIAALNMLALDFKVYLKSIEQLKGHSYNPDDWQGAGPDTSRKFDMHGVHRLAITWNIFYHIGINLNGWRVAKNEKNKTELARYQMMLVAWDTALSETSSKVEIEKLTTRINYYSNISNKLDAKIKDFEGS